MKELDQLIDSGHVHTVFVGASAMPGRKRFATFRTGPGETVATGAGDTCEEALRDALGKLGRIPAVTTQPAMPGMTRNRMPGM